MSSKRPHTPGIPGGVEKAMSSGAVADLLGDDPNGEAAVREIADAVMASALDAANVAHQHGPALGHMAAYRYWVVVHACELGTKEPALLDVRVSAIADVFADYSPTVAVNVMAILQKIPDARTCEHPLLIKRLRYLADLAGLKPMPKTGAAL